MLAFLLNTTNLLQHHFSHMHINMKLIASWLPVSKSDGHSCFPG
jgi:hypothetical protein